MPIFIKPWVRNVRRAFLWVGLGWLALSLLKAMFSPEPSSFVWALIGTIFMASIFLPVALLLSVFFPTYVTRMIGVPIVLTFVFWSLVSQSAAYTGFELSPFMVLWIVTFTSISLLLPQMTSVIAFFRRERHGGRG